MAVHAKILPVNSLVFVHGGRGWISPLPVAGKPIWSTPSCIATICFPEVDGPTEIILGEAREILSVKTPVFDGMLETPQSLVCITTVDDDRPVLSFEVLGMLTRVRIWHNHPIWPDIVTVGLGDS